MKAVQAAGLALVALTFALGGCAAGHGQAAPATAQWLAVARGRVDVEGGMVQVGARTDGVVRSVAVKPGDHVDVGQALATLDARAATIQVKAAEAGVAQARAQLAELQVSLQQARQRAPRIAAAAKAGAATGESASQARDAVAALEARHAAAAAAVDAAQQKLAAARLTLAATTLRAPVAGSVVLRQITVGQSVSAASGQPLFELLPERPRIVRAQVNADAAGSIHPGMRAEVVRDSGTGPTYEATVTWVGEVLQSATLTQDPLQRALANDVDCTLSLAPPKAGEAPLRIGQRVLVKFPNSVR